MTMKRIAELDGLRALAVSMVIVAHCQTVAPLAFNLGILINGTLGVILFFVLSGYLITRLLVEERQRTGKISLTAFYMRRAVRILPASYFYLAVVAIVAWLGLANVAWQQLLVTALHLWNYGTLLLPPDMPSQGSIVLGHFWSLALEEQFYWIWPMVFLWLAPRRTRMLLLAIVAGMALIRLGSYALWPFLRGNLGMMFHTALDPLAVGALLAVCEQPLRVKMAQLNGHVITAAIAILLLALPLVRAALASYWSVTYGMTIDAVVAGFVILAMTCRPDHGFAAVMRAPPLQFVGKISFSLYLWQQAFCPKGAMFEMHPMLAVPSTVLAATLSFYGIERPFLKLRSRFVAASSPVEPPVRTVSSVRSTTV